MCKNTCVSICLCLMYGRFFYAHPLTTVLTSSELRLQFTDLRHNMCPHPLFGHQWEVSASLLCSHGLSGHIRDQLPDIWHLLDHISSDAITYPNGPGMASGVCDGVENWWPEESWEQSFFGWRYRQVFKIIPGLWRYAWRLRISYSQKHCFKRFLLTRCSKVIFVK